MTSFTVRTAKHTYVNERDSDDMLILRSMGFEFKQARECVYQDEDDPDNEAMMKFTDIKGEFYIHGEPSIDIMDLKHLMSFIESLGDIVLTSSSITIYNDYLE